MEEYSVQLTLSRYSQATSLRDWEMLFATFADDAIWEAPALATRFEGIEAIRRGFVALNEPMDYVVQTASPAVIEVTGDTASARSVVRELAKYPGRSEALEALGVFHDRLVKKAGRWVFVHRRLEVIGMHNFPLSPPAGA